MLVSFVYVSSIGRVLNQEQYLVKDCGLRGDDNHASTIIGDSTSPTLVVIGGTR